MNTCPWRENRPGLIILEPRPAPEESLASVIIGKWCNTLLYTPHCSVVTRAIVKSRTMSPGWPSQLFSSNSMTLERKKRRRRKRRSESTTSLNESGSSGSSGQSLSGKLRKWREQIEWNNKNMFIQKAAGAAGDPQQQTWWHRSESQTMTCRECLSWSKLQCD